MLPGSVFRFRATVSKAPLTVGRGAVSASAVVTVNEHTEDGEVVMTVAAPTAALRLSPSAEVIPTVYPTHSRNATHAIPRYISC